MDVHAASGLPTIYEAEDVTPRDFDGRKPSVTWRRNGETHEVTCDFIAGCDGFHGASRSSVPEAAISSFERIYPFGWRPLVAVGHSEAAIPDSATPSHQTNSRFSD